MKDVRERASERCKRLIADYEQPKLDPAVDEELADFVARRLSPGGAADTLAAACWVMRICGSAA